MAALKVFCVLVSLLALGLSAPLTCPHTEELIPCSCKRLAYGLQVVCAKFDNSLYLIKALRILRDYRVHTVLLHELHFSDILPTDLFNGMDIKEIQIEKSNLIFPQPAFKGLDSTLNVLNVAQGSMIKSNDRFSLAKLTRLTELTVQANSLQRVENMWLNEKVPNVATVILDSNEITELESKAFANLMQLKTISLSNNRIQTVKRSMLPQPAEKLRRIDLSYNEISSLPKDFFTEMPNLREIILSGNELKTLPEETWQPVWEQLTQILLYENQLECSDEIQWIKRYKKPYQIDGNCVLPKNMAGRSVKELYKT